MSITQENLIRVDGIIESSFQTCKCCDLPLPSWIELSISEFCTKRCIFCPKGNDKIAPNQKLYMNSQLAEKLGSELRTLDFHGTVMLGGYGEPLIHKQLNHIIRQFCFARVEITTNGDLLTSKIVEKIYESGTSYVVISLYDGPHQIEHFNKMFSEVGINTNQYCMRDRWYDEKKDFGVILTNRAGTVNIGKQEVIDIKKQCYYPHYLMSIDWNGDILVCPQDWHRRIKFGNVSFSSIHDIWNSSIYNNYRKKLYNHDRSLFPCNECNCKGTKHGKTHADYWESK